MRTSQQALQDALDSGAVAAFIAGKEIQYNCIHGKERWKDSIDDWPRFLDIDYQWRPAPASFPEPPAGESWHNPDNLTPEQVGEDYRLLLASEIKDRDWNEDIHKWHEVKWSETTWRGSSKDFTFRVPASTPFHWDAPKRVPLAPEDFIGAWLKFKDDGLAIVTNINNPGIIYIRDRDFTIQQLIEENILVRLANTTEFVPCWREEAV